MSKNTKAAKSTKVNTDSALVLGLFRQGTKVAKMVMALKAKPRSLKEIAKIYGVKSPDQVRPMVYGAKRIGKNATPKFTIEVENGVARLLTGKKAA